VVNSQLVCFWALWSLGLLWARGSWFTWRGVATCITTFPSREAQVVRALATLRRQFVAPEILYLCLEDDRYPGRVLPEKLKREIRRNPRIQIVWSRETALGPFNKLIPAVPFLIQHDRQAVTVDDDVRYSPFLFLFLRQTVRDNPGEVCGLRGWQIHEAGPDSHPYVRWMPLRAPSSGKRVFLTGVGAVAYPQAFLRSRLLVDSTVFNRLCHENDDVWFWAIAALEGLEVTFRPPRARPHYLPITKPAGAEELYRRNRGGGGADRAFQSVMTEFPKIREQLKNQ